LELLIEASRSRLSAARRVALALDCAASEFFIDGKYILHAEEKRKYSAEDLIEFYSTLVRDSRIFHRGRAGPG